MAFNEKKKLDDRLYAFALAIITCVKTLPSDTVAREIGRQLVRSGTSVTANIVEARAASSKKDYINFYTHALKSANETELWLRLLRDSFSAPEDGTGNLLIESSEIAKILGASVRTMKLNLNSQTKNVVAKDKI